ncbi:DUF6884 domain-containing protein [Methanococcus maripaludis]|uniref:DUF6884 domain-containing protein n=1 Tax=Methanococcus maripaludis TaxID=39152 RepID=A0A2L1C9B1_METMI|nr:DUF6884 domain-containing protein [Methanococcus maripaludis]AVB75945.1 hypothetical protein MMJJ_05280 [Methanococcus maripaludis]
MTKNDNIIIITACGGSKEGKPQKAGTLYKSSRIRHLYKKALEFDVPFYILSAKYGLINSEKIIDPYNQIMTKERALFLKPSVKKTLEDFEYVVFFEGGARKEYRDLIHESTNELGLQLIAFGYKTMGDIGELKNILGGINGFKQT